MTEIDLDFRSRLLVDAELAAVFNCINDIRAWWSEDFKGSSGGLNDEFEVRFGDVHYSRQKLVEVVADRRIVWLVTDSHLNFVKKTNEWTGTRVSFEISRVDGRTEIQFTHFGLVPAVECFEGCTGGWRFYLSSLLGLINEGSGQPYKVDGQSQN